MRIARLILSISIFIFMFDVSAQGSYAMRTYAKSAKDACSAGVLFYGDFKEYHLDHNVRDQEKADKSKFYKAIGTQKEINSC